MYTTITFSPTGNSRYVANKINTALSNTDKVLELEKIDNLPTGQHLILVSTIRAFDYPKVVLEFLRNKIENNHFKYVSFIGVGCNTEWINSASSLRASKILSSKNIQTIVDTVVAMPLNFITDFPQNIKDDMFTKFDDDINTIVNDIKNITPAYKVVPFKAKAISKINIIEHNAAKLFGVELYANKDCIKCNKCVADCPTNNIYWKNDKLKFKLKCMLCMRCVYECPKNAISPRFSKFVLIKNGYTPPKV